MWVSGVSGFLKLLQRCLFLILGAFVGNMSSFAADADMKSDLGSRGNLCCRIASVDRSERVPSSGPQVGELSVLAWGGLSWAVGCRRLRDL